MPLAVTQAPFTKAQARRQRQRQVPGLAASYYHDNEVQTGVDLMMTPLVRTCFPPTAVISICGPRKLAQVDYHCDKKVQPRPVIRYVETCATRVVACVSKRRWDNTPITSLFTQSDRCRWSRPRARMHTRASDGVCVWLRVFVDVAPSPPWLFCQTLSFFPPHLLSQALRFSDQPASYRVGTRDGVSEQLREGKTRCPLDTACWNGLLLLPHFGRVIRWGSCRFCTL